MMGDAESHAEEDKQRKEEVETHNRAEQAIFAAEQMLKDSGDKLPETEKQSIEEALAALKTSNEGSDLEAITAAMERLNTAHHKAAEDLYKQAQQEATASSSGEPTSEAGGAGGEAGGDVIDAEVVDDEKK